MYTTEWCIILKKPELHEPRRERGNARCGATKARHFSRTSRLRNLHYWVYYIKEIPDLSSPIDRFSLEHEGQIFVAVGH